MNYLEEIIKRNPELLHVSNLRIDSVTNFKSDNHELGSRVCYSYGFLNGHIGSEDFLKLPEAWEAPPKTEVEIAAEAESTRRLLAPDIYERPLCIAIADFIAKIKASFSHVFIVE